MATTPPTYADFILRFPQFAAPAVAKISVEAQLSLSAAWLSSAWGDWYSEGVLYNTAHNVSMDVQMNSALNGGQQAAAGPVTSSSGAGLSISFEAAKYQGISATDSWYMKTAFGQKFLHLRNTVVPMGMLTA